MRPPGAPLLEVDDLRVRFDTFGGSVHAVDGISFELAPGETLAVVGESGSGKSVTMLALLGLLAEPPAQVSGVAARFDGDSGAVDLLDRRAVRSHRVRGRQIGYVAQDPLGSLNPTVSVGAQLTESLRHHLGLSRRAARARAVELLDRVGIPDAASRFRSYPHELSGGMRQRVMIAISISCEPALLIADEPTTALDVTVQAQIIDLIGDLRDEMGLAVIWITHDLGVVAGFADRVAVMYAGRIVEMAPTLDLFDDPRHPYTVGLLAAMPRVGRRRDRLEAIPGLPPELSSSATTCSFAPRCPLAFDRCGTASPPLASMGRRSVACFAAENAAGVAGG